MGKTDIEDALSRLDKLTHEEARMASAHLLKITHGVDNKVMKIDVGVKGVDNKVKGVDDKVTGVDARVIGVDDKVNAVDAKLNDVSDTVKLVLDGACCLIFSY